MGYRHYPPRAAHPRATRDDKVTDDMEIEILPRMVNIGLLGESVASAAPTLVLASA
jgi:hypothetical protein